jgi:hypothetical protein
MTGPALSESVSMDNVRKDLADNEPIEALDSLADVAQTLHATLTGIWKNFLEHILICLREF